MIDNSRRAVAILLFAWITIVLSGCGSEQHAVTGEVTFAGEPIDGGSILFLPGGGEGTKGAAEIVGGKYNIPAEQGLRPGNYRVEIRWQKPTGKQIPSGDPGMMMDERVEVIPANYNTNSTLTVAITAGKNEHSFSLKK